MISKGDIVRLFNPSEKGLIKQAHMHIVAGKTDGKFGCKRNIAVCTTSPTRYIKEGVEFLVVDCKPFSERTFIRMDPIYSVDNVKIKTISRTNPIFRLDKKTETKFFEEINNRKKLNLNRNEFIKLNYAYAIPLEKSKK